MQSKCAHKFIFLFVGLFSCFTFAGQGNPQQSTPAIATGSGHVCTLTGSGGVICWGTNSNGEVGRGYGADSTAAIPDYAYGLSSGVQSISAHGGKTCVVTTAGGVRCWGSLNDIFSSSFTKKYPTDIPGLTSGISAIAVGEHICALTNEGSVKCIGDNYFGELGDGVTTFDSTEPVQVAGLEAGVTAIAASYNSTCALLSDGTVKCWGEKLLAGNGGSGSQPAPVTVSGLSNAIALSSTGNHTCALISDGTVKCWGYTFISGYSGPLFYEATPTAIQDLSNVIAITSGNYHSCALTEAGAVKCWGFNTKGQLGNGSVTYSQTPVDVSGLSSGVVAISAGSAHTCAVLNDGGVMCWGDNTYKQLGDNTTNVRIRPVSVIGLGGTGTLSLSASTTISSSDEDCFFAWAELRYPTFFPGNSTTQTLQTYRYRYYSDTGSYLGLNSADANAYIIIPALGGSVMSIGASATWVSGARNDSCQ